MVRRRLRGPNYSHGTAGIASALAVAGVALDRPELVEAAVLGAQHLLALGTLDDGGFVVPHTIPPSKREVEPVTYTWCHGPTGTSQLFAALAHAGVEDVNGIGVVELRQRCLRSVLDSGVPRRLRPGFWDNDGRCCGTAGVGDVLLDAAQDAQDPILAGRLLAAARTMGDALLERAIRDDAGAVLAVRRASPGPARSCPRERRGCRALPASRRSCCGWHGWSRRGSTHRSSTDQTSGGQCRPGCGDTRARLRSRDRQVCDVAPVDHVLVRWNHWR